MKPSTSKRSGRARRCLVLAAAMMSAPLAVCVAHAYDARVNKRCVWNCVGPTISVAIEPQYRPGPPIIIWTRPSNEGSGQSNFTNIDNTAMQSASGSYSQTSWSLYNKGRGALKNGDCKGAVAYFDAALQRGPRANEVQDIREALDSARQSCATENIAGTNIEKFEKSPYTTILSVRDVPPAVFDEGRPDLERLRQEMMPLLLKRAEAFSRLESMKPDNSQERQKAQAEADASQQDVVQKVAEAKKIYTLD